MVRTLTLGVLLALVGASAAEAASLYSERLVVGLSGDVSSARAEGIVDRAGGRVQRRLRAAGGVIVRARSGVAVDVVLRRLRAHSSVRFAERDFLVSGSREPDDPLYSTQHALNQVSGRDVAAPETWDRTSACSKVAVLDSGVDKDHPDLRPNLWINKDETSGNGKDDDDNGVIDDYYGADMIDRKGSGTDENGHGTHVAGIIAARGDNGLGVSGICWTASVVSVKFLDKRGRGGTADAVAAIEYAVDEGAKVINCSFGTSSKSSALQRAVAYAKEEGALLVVAAGNDGNDIEDEPSYPAAFTDGNILTVAATTRVDSLADFSNYGAKSVDVAAPGVGINSTLDGGSYGEKDGTSMAAPHVAGAAALLRKADSDAGYSRLRTALRAHGDAIPGLDGKVLYGQRLDVRRALDWLL